MHTQAITVNAPSTSFVPVNPVSAVPVDSGAGLDAAELTIDGEPVFAGPGDSNPYYTVDRLTRFELMAVFYLCPRAELPTVATCPLREFEAMAVETLKTVRYTNASALADMFATPALMTGFGGDWARLRRAEALANAYFAIADLVSYDDYTGNDAEGIRAGLGEWAKAATAAPKPLRSTLDQLPEYASGVADRCDRVTGEDAPLVSVLNGARLAIALYLGGIKLPEPGLLLLNTYEDLARASVAGLGVQTVIDLEAGLRFWDLQDVCAAWPDPARYKAAAALARDVADLVRAARCRKTVARFEARL